MITCLETKLMWWVLERKGVIKGNIYVVLETSICFKLTPIGVVTTIRSPVGEKRIFTIKFEKTEVSWISQNTVPSTCFHETTVEVANTN